MKNLSYQMYSSRNFPPLSNTLDTLANLGYTAVEGYGGLFATMADVEALDLGLKNSGLKMPTTHMGLDMVEDTPELAIQIAKTLGIQRVFVPYLDAEFRSTTADGWRDFGARLNTAGAPLRDAGIGFGWHNHDFEFESGAATHPIDHILEGGPELDFEFDVAWAVRAGEDPIPVMQRYRDRLVAAHVKDIAPAGECQDEDGWADVGHGVMNWSELLSALQETACEHFVMEHDNPSDGDRFASRSFEFVHAQ